MTSVVAAHGLIGRCNSRSCEYRGLWLVEEGASIESLLQYTSGMEKRARDEDAGRSRVQQPRLRFCRAAILALLPLPTCLPGLLTLILSRLRLRLSSPSFRCIDHFDNGVAGLKLTNKERCVVGHHASHLARLVANQRQ